MTHFIKATLVVLAVAMIADAGMIVDTVSMIDTQLTIANGE